ncbi:MAG: RsmB/NOP family class I SAM-dependent RNA methyltransferase [Alphaproteobacteria bacterium]|nr:RsmB/NOP family class I SAM-dependent RNA methyltransferase [Alphaproteobacteria bacterium]
MRESARAKTTSDILKDARVKPADKVISEYFRANKYIGSKDKKAILNRFYRILRNWFKILWLMERYSIQPSTFYFVLFDSALQQEDYKEIFDGGPYSFSRLNPETEKLYKNLKKQSLTSKEIPLQAKLECSNEYWELFKETFSNEEDLNNELMAMQKEAPFDLRVNLIKTDRKDILNKIKEASPTPLSPVGIRMKKRININELSEFKNGEIEVQDEGSQLIALIVDAKPGEKIVDFCAGAGGKTLAMAATMKNKGRITACDIFEGKLKRAKQRFKRSDVQNTSTKLLDKTSKKWIHRNTEKMDKVLVDAPCSGSGTWRRNPDMKIKPIDIKSITSTQLEILERASKLVKKNGFLYYATCSLFQEENQNVVNLFLEKHSDFELSEIKNEFVGENQGTFQSSPYRTNTDGFFVAKIKKN